MFLWGDGQQKKRAPMIPLPKEAASRAASLGKAGAQWLSHLEKTLQSLESQWGVPAGGSHGLACPCDGQDGEAYVLKIDVPPGSIWGWGCLQTVSTGLVLLQAGRRTTAKPCWNWPATGSPWASPKRAKHRQNKKSPLLNKQQSAPRLYPRGAFSSSVKTAHAATCFPAAGTPPPTPAYRLR